MNIHNLVQAFLHTFENIPNNNPIDNSKEFLALHPGVSKWTIASDYCIGDKKSKYDCFSFTIFSYNELPPITFDHIQKKLPKDIKKSRKLPENAILFFQEPNRFHISVVIDKKRNLFVSDANNSSASKVRAHIKADLQRAAESQYPPETLNRLKKLVRKSEAKSFNLKLFENIILLASFYVFISILLLKGGKAEKIGWFSDRDKMISYCEGVIWDFAVSGFYTISRKMGLETSCDQILIAGHKEIHGITEDMWYDPLIRPADYLSSALSTWHVSANGTLNIPNTKQGNLLRNAIANNKNIIILYPRLKNPEIIPIVERVMFHCSKKEEQKFPI